MICYALKNTTTLLILSTSCAKMDAHIVVDSRITVSEGHMIADVVRDVLIEEFDDVQDVLVHGKFTLPTAILFSPINLL
jgi:divalent metal cation (Fe/Co/Zn/Cd) transporter